MHYLKAASVIGVLTFSACALLYAAQWLWTNSQPGSVTWPLTLAGAVFALIALGWACLVLYVLIRALWELF